jgi:hypothetical protein
MARPAYLLADDDDVDVVGGVDGVDAVLSVDPSLTETSLPLSRSGEAMRSNCFTFSRTLLRRRGDDGGEAPRR